MLVHGDVWGLCNTTLLEDLSIFVKFVDGYSVVTWLYLMKEHLELLSMFTFSEVKTHFSMSVQFYKAIMPRTTYLTLLRYLCLLVESCNNHHARATYNKMALQNEKFTSYLKLLDPYYSRTMPGNRDHNMSGRVVFRSCQCIYALKICSTRSRPI